MSNFCNDFNGRNWSRRPPGFIVRQKASFEEQGTTMAAQPRLNPTSTAARGTASHGSVGKRDRAGGRNGIGEWGKQQFNRLRNPNTNSTVSHGGIRGQGSGTDVRQGTVQVNPLKTDIKDLYPHQPNTVITGIVVGKFSVHSFPDKKNPGTERFKFTFTMRDSPSDYINATCWGSEEYIKRLHGSFKICNVVELQNGQILSKTNAEYDDRWKPWTPSHYQINVSETYSTLILYDGMNYTNFTALAHVPLRPSNDYYTLSDILSSGQSLGGSFINILAIVKHVGAPKQMTSRYGKPLKKCEVRLMDDGCSSFSLLLWDEELIELAQSWTPKENIIFAVDVRVTFDTYRNCMVASCNQKSIITTNPDCHEAHQLYQYGQTVEVGPAHSQEDLGNFSSTQENIHTISQVFTVEWLLDHQSSSAAAHSTTGMAPPNSFSGILFAVLTCLDIDDSLGMAVCYRCVSCHFKVEKEAIQCTNKNCTGMNFSMELHYNLLISLSDHTGGVNGVRLQGQAACDLLKCTPQEFITKSESERTMLKCSLLLERFKVFFRSGYQMQQEKRSPPLRVLNMSPAHHDEAMSHITFL